MSTQEMNAMGYDNKTPKFNGKNYAWWKNRIKNIIIGIDYECWLVVKNGPLTIEKSDPEGKLVPKTEDEYISTDYKKLEKNAKAMSILQQAIAENETNRISACTTAKEIWDTLELAFEGTSEVKRSKIDLLMSKYESFNMFKDEDINTCFGRFMTIVNDLKSLGKSFTDEDLVRKILRSLTGEWTPKVTAIYEAKDLSILSVEQLIGSLMTHEMLVGSKSEKVPAKGIALKGTVEDEDDEIGMMARRFERSFRNQKGKFIKGKFNNASNKKSNNFSATGCFKCGEKGHLVKNCPQWKDNQSKEADKMAYKKAMVAAVWGDTDSDEEGDDSSQSDVCMTAILNQSSEEGTRNSRGTSSDVHCLMAKKHPLDQHQVNIDQIKKDMLFYDRENLMECASSALDQCLELGIAYHDFKRKFKEKSKEYDIANSSCDLLESVCANLKQEVAELEIALDQSKLEIQRIKSDMGLCDDSDDECEKQFTSCVINVLDYSGDDLYDFDSIKSRASALNRSKLLEGFNLLVDDVEELYKAYVLVKNSKSTGSETVSSNMHDECEAKICSLQVELAQLRKTNSCDSVVLHDSSISKLQAELERAKLDFEIVVDQNLSLHEKMNLKDREFIEFKKRMDKVLQSQNSLNQLTLTAGNSGRRGLGYTGKGNRRNWSPRDTTWLQEYKKGKYVLAKDMHVCYHCGKNGHKKYECKDRKSRLDKNKKNVKQIWVRKDLLESVVGKGPKKIWVPKANV